MNDKECIEIIEEFCKNLIENMVDLDLEFQRVVDDHFWELI